MPPVNPPADQWLARKIQQMEADIRALKNARTQYIVDPTTGETQAIIGDLSKDPAGNNTGLTGFGIACLVGGEWVLAHGTAPGDLIPGAGTTRPACLLCDGTAYILTAHPELDALATACPNLVSGGTLTVPDLRGRGIIGAGTGPGLTARTLGQTGGEETHLLLAAEGSVNGNGATGNDSPDHTHTAANGNAFVAGGGGTSANVTTGGGGYTTQLTTSGRSAFHQHPLTARNADLAHNNMQPFGVANWFVKT